MTHPLRPVGLAAALSAAAFGLAGPAAAQDRAPHQIIVMGEGEATAKPDRATVTLGVEAEAATPREASDMMSEAAARVIDRLVESGIPRAAIQTGQLTLDQQYGEEPSDERPFLAGTMLTVRVTDLDSLGEVLNAAITDGANRLQGVDFGIEDDSVLREEARRDAVADARERAEVLADAAGVSLGDILQISETGSGRPRPMQRGDAMMVAEAALPVAPGDLTVSQLVEIVWEIDEGDEDETEVGDQD
ncbi:SIMPL domain-containing protein [Pseudoroseicyclus aestuarii]|uniref:SIMPL domain-containing protein n=1 Tax=Pseudoroseicyclus aestuarii TaxID=1795041 RepID=A0A318SU85_9RHOB|nr:SIMPL domain-containing protein [Pseudoroseicyclus aestuarii]PYE82360.1 hypothetical protein DFP88_104114 [Pseudoroseicyclus aestuarii]